MAYCKVAVGTLAMVAIAAVDAVAIAAVDAAATPRCERVRHALLHS